MQFRQAVKSDYPTLGRVMYDAIHGPGSPYTQAERTAWLAAPRSGPDWDLRLEAQWVVVAEDEAGICGFMSLAAKAYLDFAYLLPRAQGSGTFRGLYEKVEAEALRQGHTRIWVHASLRAEPAFAAMGFVVTDRQSVARGSQTLRRAEMEKQLETP